MKIKKVYSRSECKEMAESLYTLACKQKKAYQNNNSLQEDRVLYEMSALILKLSYASFSSVCNFENIESEGIEDIIQDSACMIYKKFKNHEYDPTLSDFPINAILLFIKNIIKGEYLNFYKLRKIHQQKTINIESWDDNEDSTNPMEKLTSNEDEKDNFFYQDSLHRLAKTLIKLAKDDKEKTFINMLFIQKFLGNALSKTEIAETLGCSNAYVTKKEKQLLEKFQSLLNKEDYF